MQEVTLQIGPKKILWLKKLKILFLGHMLLMILTGKKLLELFMKKDCKKTNQKEFRIKKVIQRKGDKYMLNGKDTIICLITE